MIKALRYFWREQPIALGVFVLALALLLFFGTRFVMQVVYFHDPAHRNQTLEAWMSPRYVAMSYRLPREEIVRIFQLDRLQLKRPQMDDIAGALGLTLEELDARVKGAARAFKQEHGKGQGRRLAPDQEVPDQNTSDQRAPDQNAPGQVGAPKSAPQGASEEAPGTTGSQ